MLQRYSGKVRFVHLDFPLDGHPEAVPAARAARCAGEQGRFWEFHRSMMSRPGPLDTADLKGRAATLKLDAAKFGACLASDQYDEAIQAELQQGTELGRHGHARLLRERPHAVGRPPGRVVRRGHRRRARTAQGGWGARR